MFAVDEATAHAIRQAYQDGGELSGVVEPERVNDFDTGGFGI